VVGTDENGDSDEPSVRKASEAARRRAEAWERDLQRVCAKFPTTISAEKARRLALLPGSGSESTE